MTTQIPDLGSGGVTEMVSEPKLQYSETRVLRVKSKKENDVRDHSKVISGLLDDVPVSEVDLNVYWRNDSRIDRTLRDL